MAREEFSFTYGLWPQEEGLGATVTDLGQGRLRIQKDTSVTDKTWDRKGPDSGTTPGNQRAQMSVCGLWELEGLLNEDAAEKAIGWMGKPRRGLETRYLRTLCG